MKRITFMYRDGGNYKTDMGSKDFPDNHPIADSIVGSSVHRTDADFDLLDETDWDHELDHQFLEVTSIMEVKTNTMFVSDTPNCSHYEIKDVQDAIEAFYPDYTGSTEITQEDKLYQYMNGELELTDEKYEGMDDEDATDAYIMEEFGWAQEDLDDGTPTRMYYEIRCNILEKTIHGIIEHKAELWAVTVGYTHNHTTSLHTSMVAVNKALFKHVKKNWAKLSPEHVLPNDLSAPETKDKAVKTYFKLQEIHGETVHIEQVNIES